MRYQPMIVATAMLTLALAGAGTAVGADHAWLFA